MANKYIISGATYYGDGTSSAEATVDGGVGAWNNMNIMTGTTPTYGTLAAGDTVYIRSKTSAGANVSVTVSAAVSIGVAAATEANPVKWVVDAGTVWSGVSGTVTFSTNGAYLITQRNWNNLIGTNYNLIFYAGSTAYNVSQFWAGGASYTDNVMIDMSFTTLNNGAYMTLASGWHNNLYVKSAKRYDQLIKSASVSQLINLVNLRIELLDNTVAQPVFNLSNNYAGHFLVFGGEVTGVGCIDTAPLVVAGSNPSEIKLFGFKYPRNMPLGNTSVIIPLAANACDGAVGVVYWDRYFTYDSRNDNNYPTRYATLELSTAATWAYKVYPFNTTFQQPANITIGKLYTQTAAAKTVTLQLLWPSTFSTPTSDKVFMIVQYTDSTGVVRSETTETAGATNLATSTATWSTTTYGSVSLSKYELAITTDYSIKQDTQIIVAFFCRTKSASVNDILFVDPDVELS